ncbi:MAG: hypothetical protein C4547_14410 [Phycisphaerales bacterium]|nr:MAG: hypothetical protein C4547_14410 [Phycisphaerales bacterium]
MSQTNVVLNLEPPLARVFLSTDNGVNVLSAGTMERLGEVAREVDAHPDVRVAVITGLGKVFAAGADIKAMSDYEPPQADTYARLGKDVLNQIEGLSKVTIACINGPALGGGLELALACDLRIAVRTAKLGLPEVTIGVIPGWAGMQRLPKLIGPARARRMILSGEPVKAEDALPFGLVDEVVNSPEDLAARADVLARTFYAAGPNAVALAKRALHDGDDVGAFAECFGDDADGREGIAAFLEKRKPNWAPAS